ncbi:origin recognition complex subunit 5 [Anabrus simplex]|uniref:origin recognition complex subunit 5 n=1 Tax=Anabrus simplex TaxID=316456 RepID=UPI0035A38456
MSKRKEVYNEDIVEQELKEEILCRSDQISSLLQLIGRPKGEVPQSIFVYGHTGTGKTFVTTKILRKLKYKYVIVDCVHCYLPKLLFGSILDGMTECEEDSPYAGCDNMLDFIYHLRTLFAASSWKEEAFIIVLENSERLLQMDTNLLPALLRLQELTKENLCVIFMSSIIFEKFYLKTGFCDPILVHFPQYSKDDVLKILSKNHDWPSQDALYQNYLNLFLSVFYRSCRDLNELRHMVNRNFMKHCEPVVSGKVDVTKLWQTITPHLKSALTELYLRMVASKELEETPQSIQNQNEVSTRKLALSFELPYYTKYFLIAGFLASYSPPKLDKALFVKLSEKKRRKRMSVRSKQELLNDMLLGPKPFTADRLLAIFYSIVGEEVNFTVNLSAQISSLVKLKLLVEVDNSLDHHKYKCAVGMEFIKTIAKTVGFDVVKFLFPPK